MLAIRRPPGAGRVESHSRLTLCFRKTKTLSSANPPHGGTAQNPPVQTQKTDKNSIQILSQDPRSFLVSKKHSNPRQIDVKIRCANVSSKDMTCQVLPRLKKPYKFLSKSDSFFHASNLRFSQPLLCETHVFAIAHN